MLNEEIRVAFGGNAIIIPLVNGGAWIGTFNKDQILFREDGTISSIQRSDGSTTFLRRDPQMKSIAFLEQTLKQYHRLGILKGPALIRTSHT